MKRGSLVLSLFLVSILVISGCDEELSRGIFGKIDPVKDNKYLDSVEQELVLTSDGGGDPDGCDNQGLANAIDNCILNYNTPIACTGGTGSGGNFDEYDVDNDGICDDVDDCVVEDGASQECGCNTGIAEGACDCDGNVLDCANECAGTAVENCIGECNGDSSCSINLSLSHDEFENLVFTMYQEKTSNANLITLVFNEKYSVIPMGSICPSPPL